jgi:hypothetical protein
MSYFQFSSFNKLNLSNLFVSQIGASDSEIGAIIKIIDFRNEIRILNVEIEDLITA